MQVLFLAFLIVSLINLCYYLLFAKFALGSSAIEKPEILPPVSVIICAKNEAENLRQFLPAVLAQNYPTFEMIFINDASSDDTLNVIEEFQGKDERIKIVNVENNEAFWANKKYALTLGIKKASHPYLLFTDADCEPQSNHWIYEMASNFSTSKSIVLGYGGYIKQASFLNKLIRFETLLTAVQYFSFAKWGMPYMGVGRNLAYTSEKFFAHNGFASHLHLHSGDDDLFVNEAATGRNIAICANSAGITRSIAKTSFKAWYRQKRRHISTSGKYKLSHRFTLGLFYVSQLIFWILFAFSLFSIYWKAALVVLLLRILVQFVVFYKSAKKLKENQLLWLFPFLELSLICFQLIIFIANIFSKPTHWK